MTATAAPLLVTGASGFLGRHLLEVCTPAQQPLLALVRDAQSWRAENWTAEHENVRLVEGSVTELDPQSSALPPLGGIFHLAALVRHSRRNAEEVYETNVQGTLRMVHLAAAHGCRLVVLSSTGTVGCSRDPDFLADEETPHCAGEVTGWPYYRSKLFAEELILEACSEAFETLTVNPSLLLGPDAPRASSLDLVSRYLSGGVPALPPGGLAFVDVRDAAAGVCDALERGEPGQRYLLNSANMTFVEFFERLARLEGTKAPALRLPRAAHRLMAFLPRAVSDRLPGASDLEPEEVEMASHYWYADASKAKDELSWTARDPGLTLDDTLRYLQGLGISGVPSG